MPSSMNCRGLSKPSKRCSAEHPGALSGCQKRDGAFRIITVAQLRPSFAEATGVPALSLTTHNCVLQRVRGSLLRIWSPTSAVFFLRKKDLSICLFLFLVHNGSCPLSTPSVLDHVPCICVLSGSPPQGHPLWGRNVLSCRHAYWD